MATMWMGVLALEPVAGALPQRQMLTRATAEGLNEAMGAQRLGERKDFTRK